MANYFCTDSVEEQVDLLTDKVKDLNTKKLDKAAVVQETGTGTNVVMSQKAVTDTVNENLQTINTEINGKLTKPTNPSAESAVTMLADGTVGTKPLSEIGGGGKLYKHTVYIQFKQSNFNYTLNFYAYSSDDTIFSFLTFPKGYFLGMLQGFSTGTVQLSISEQDGQKDIYLNGFAYKEAQSAGAIVNINITNDMITSFQDIVTDV